MWRPILSQAAFLPPILVKRQHSHTQHMLCCTVYKICDGDKVNDQRGVGTFIDPCNESGMLWRVAWVHQAEPNWNWGWCPTLNTGGTCRCSVKGTLLVDKKIPSMSSGSWWFLDKFSTCIHSCRGVVLDDTEGWVYDILIGLMLQKNPGYDLNEALLHLGHNKT